MTYTRRGFGQFALAAVPAAGLLRPAICAAQGKPNSLFGGVQVGVITYSYRTMPDQSSEAYLKYIVDSGVSAIELMGDPAESYAGRPAQPRRVGGRGQQLTPEHGAGNLPWGTGDTPSSSTSPTRRNLRSSAQASTGLEDVRSDAASIRFEIRRPKEIPGRSTHR